MSDMSEATRERLMGDVKAVIHDAEELLRHTADDAGEKMTDLRHKLGERLKDARERLAHLESEVLARTKEAAQATDKYVHEHPWQSVGVAAAAGLLVGVLLGRR